VTGSGADNLELAQGPVPDPVFGGRVWVAEAGPRDGPGVFLVHGLGDTGHRDFDSLFSRLARDRRVVALDLPGFGRSDKGNRHYTPGRYADLVRRLAWERLGERYDLVGHSLGGAVALAVAKAAPREVERLILANVAGILHRQAYAEQLAYFGLDIAGGIDRLLDGALGGFLGGLLTDLVRPVTRLEPDLGVLLDLAPVRRRLLGGDPARIAALALITEGFGPVIAGVEAPPLLIWGADDRVAPLRTGKVLRALIPGATLEVLDGCGHVPMREAPERFEELVRERLAAPPPRRGEPPRSSPPASAPAERRSGESGVRITGEFDRLELSRCRDAMISGARARSIALENSTAEIEDTIVDGGEAALVATGSRTRITGGALRGDVALAIEDSNLDLAGTSLTGRRALARCSGERPCDLLFSVCPADGPGRRGHLHGIHRVSRSRDL